MTRDEIVRMAHEVGILMRSHEYQDEPTKLEKFAELVAAHEREACAKVCESFGVEWQCQSTTSEITTAIRARS